MKQKMFYNQDIKESLETAVEHNLPVLLVGDTGTGKTSFVRELAQIRGKELIRINLTGQTGVDELIGKYLANATGTYWVDGLLTLAMKTGDWVVLDEINMALPEILSKLHSLLDDDRKIVLNEKEGEIIRPHDNFRFFATMNPCDEYAGTKELNKAFLSRFPIVIEVAYSAKETDIIVERTNINRNIATKLVRIAKEIRSQKKKEAGITYTCSTRDLIYCGILAKSGLDFNLALEIAILNKAPKDEQTALKKLVELLTGKPIKINEEVTYLDIDELIKKAKEFENDRKNLQTSIKERDEKINELNMTIIKLRN